ncbi:hypothetical protein [uncultured Sulfitobacter sp.]|uniref:hypothetical protein n=1 Tax=uncultured Sulfitobacter sp. TaxID=191468 RepID=UPI00263803E6|nr:hypothetical protein [uncultured Sulfitobacter sp.]
MFIQKIALVTVACATLAACGDSIGEQALGGGVVGAGAAAATGGSIGQGAAIGAGANVVACQTDIADCD